VPCFKTLLSYHVSSGHGMSWFYSSLNKLLDIANMLFVWTKFMVEIMHHNACRLLTLRIEFNQSRPVYVVIEFPLVLRRWATAGWSVRRVPVRDQPTSECGLWLVCLREPYPTSSTITLTTQSSPTPHPPRAFMSKTWIYILFCFCVLSITIISLAGHSEFRHWLCL